MYYNTKELTRGVWLSAYFRQRAGQLLSLSESWAVCEHWFLISRLSTVVPVWAGVILKPGDVIGQQPPATRAETIGVSIVDR